MKKIVFSLLATINVVYSFAQGLHFSQFYNAPLFLNPSNTGLLPDDDYRGGMVYRNQFSTVPVPYVTTGAFADMGLLRNKYENSWIGVGLGIWDDKAGDGNLRLTKTQATVAYHIMTDERTMWSVGMGAGLVNRTIDFSRLTFLSQWDEFSFNNGLPNQENVTQGKTSYVDANIGARYLYGKEDKYNYSIGGAVLHVNQPKETFLNGGTNRLGMRAVLNAEANFKSGDNLIISPSAYFTTQKRASELLFGAMGTINLNRRQYINTDRNELLLGAYHRLGDALIFCAGYNFNNFRLMCSYDRTISSLAQANSGFGAFEITLLYFGKYSNTASDRRTFGCPRF